MHHLLPNHHLSHHPIGRFLSLDHVVFAPVERRQAPIVQAVLGVFLLIGLLALTITLTDPRPIPLLIRWIALAAGTNVLVGAGAGILLLRYGAFAGAVWIGAFGIVVGTLLFIAATGLIETSEFALGLVLPLMFAGLLLRRTHLWMFIVFTIILVAALFIGEPLIVAHTGVPITDPTKGTYDRLFWPISLLCIYIGMGTLLDRFSVTLRTALRVSLQREQELRDMRDHLERTVQERTQDLREALAMNQHLLTARSEAVREAVHDLRHAATRVQATIDVWHLDLISAVHNPQELQQCLNEGYQRLYLAMMEQIELMDEMRDATMLEAGTLVLKPELVDIVVLVAEVVERTRPRFELADCGLDLVCAEALPYAWVDARRFRRVVANILDNALRYTSSVRDDGHVQVDVRSNADGMLSVIIGDNGRGIAPDQCARLGQIFTRLRQGESSPDGMGLGLYVCQGILTMSGGTLTIDSPGEGMGATVTLQVPAITRVEQN